MSINHHLSEGLILAYAAGSLPEAYSLIAAAHISMCDDCRAAATAYEALGGAVIDDGDSAALCQDSLAKTFARISAPALGLPVVVTPKAPSVLPAPLQDYLGARLEDVKWRNVGMGVRQCVLKTKGSQTARLLHIPAGTAVPDHGHGGLELTLVLKGAFSDKTGRFGVGDVEVADQSVEHTPVADPDMDCICLAVTDAPLRFKSFLHRALQPFLGI